MIEKQAFEIVIAQERQILDIQVRQDRARLRELLHPDFEEFWCFRENLGSRVSHRSFDI